MTKADKIRRMFAKGMTAAEIVKKLKCSPSQVYRLQPKDEKPKKLTKEETVERVKRLVQAWKNKKETPLAVDGTPIEDVEVYDIQANDRQVGGEHYLQYGNIQPWDTWLLWNLNPFQAAILKYVVRYRDKDGLKDLEKAQHFLDKLIEVESKPKAPSET